MLGWAGRAGWGVALAGLALSTAACSAKQNSGSADLIYGKQQFVAKCGSCHTLARANTKGTVGPDLDEAFRGGIEEAHGRSAIRGVVEYQVRYPNRRGVMPSDIARGATLNDISAYVAEAAARPGSDSGLLASAVAAPGAGKPAVEKAGKLALEANPQGQLAYTTEKATATPGPVTISMRNMSGVTHNLAVQPGTSGPVLGATPIQSKGESVDHGQPQAGHLHVLLPGARTPRGRDARHDHRQVARPGASRLSVAVADSSPTPPAQRRR